MKIPFNTTRLAILALGSLAFLPARALAAPAQYNVTDLGTLGGDTSHGNAINASGQVAGESQTTGNASTHAARWTGNTAVDLGVTIGGISYISYAVGINAAGQVVGSYYPTTTSVTRAVRWTGTKAVILGPRSVDGFAINTSGQVAGSYDALNDGHTHAGRWTGTAVEDLGTLGGSFSFGLGINDSGQVAGESTLPFPNTSVFHAVRWTGTTAVDLGTLGGSTSQGNAINTSGQVAGSADLTNNSASHATRWTGTTPTDLGTLGGTTSQGYAINASGQVTGMSRISPTLTTQHAFLYTSGKMYDLETLLVSGSGVTELVISYQGNNINDLGQIAATGRVNGGSQHALLLTPVPVVNFAITGATNDGAIIHFTASTGTGLDVRVQSRIDQQGWNDLPDGNGAKMTESTTTPGDYTLDSTFYPPGTAISFRAIASKLNQDDIISVKSGQYTLTRAVLSIDVQAKTNTDKVHGTVTRAGDDLTYTFTVINSGSATARDLKVVAKIPSYIENQTNLNKQFDIPLDSSNHPKISSGGVPYPATSATALDAKIIWDAGELAPGAQFSEAFTVHITSNVRTLQNIGMPNDYIVYGANYQPPYAATGFSSGSPNVATEVRGPISFTATALSTVVAPGGLITYKFKLANLTNTAVTGAAAVISVPEFTRFAKSYPTAAGGTVPGVVGVAAAQYEQVFATAQTAPQILIDVGPLAAAGEPLDSLTFKITFQAQWADPAAVPSIGSFDYYAAFFNGDLITNPYNQTGPQITQYDLFKLKFSKAGTTTAGARGPIDFIAFITQTDHETTLSHQDSGDVSTPFVGSADKSPILFINKYLDNDPSTTADDDLGSARDPNGDPIYTIRPGKQFTTVLKCYNLGKSLADDVFIQDRLPEGTALVPGSVQINGATVTGDDTPGAATHALGDAYYFTDLRTLVIDGGSQPLSIKPGAFITLSYRVKVKTNAPAAAVGSVLHVATAFAGTSSLSATSYFPGDYPVAVTGKTSYDENVFQFPRDLAAATDIKAAKQTLNTTYAADPNANVGSIAGDKGFFIHYQNTGDGISGNVEIDFPVPNHSVFYRARFLQTVQLPSGTTALQVRNASPAESINPLASIASTGNVAFNITGIPAGTDGWLLVEVLETPDALSATPPGLFGKATISIPTVTASARPASGSKLSTIYPDILLSSFTTFGRALANAAPKIGIQQTSPLKVKHGDNYTVTLTLINYGDTPINGQFLYFRVPVGTQLQSATSANSNFLVSGLIPSDPTLYEIYPANDYGPMPGHLNNVFAAHSTITVSYILTATGQAGGSLTYTESFARISGLGDIYTPPGLSTYIQTDNPLFGFFSSIGDNIGSFFDHINAGLGSVLNTVLKTKAFRDRLSNSTISTAVGGVNFICLDNGVVQIPIGGDQHLYTGPASNIVAQGGGNIVDLGGGNIVAQGGGNYTLKNIPGFADLTGATVVATLPSLISHRGGSLINCGGGNLISKDGSTLVGTDGFSLTGGLIFDIVAQGGGNIVAQGGGNIVNSNGAGIVAQGGGNIVAQGGGNIITIGGGSIVAQGGGNIVAQGGGNAVSSGDSSAIVATGGGNIVAGSSGNIVAQGGGN